MTPAYSPVEYRASRKYIDFSRGVLNETSARRTAEARQRIVPDVAWRGRNTILPHVQQVHVDYSLHPRWLVCSFVVDCVEMPRSGGSDCDQAAGKIFWMPALLCACWQW
jgi:hypothetical protein